MSTSANNISNIARVVQPDDGSLSSNSSPGSVSQDEHNALQKQLLRLIFAFHGLDSNLDSELDSVRQSIRSEVTAGQRIKIIQSTSERIIRFALTDGVRGAVTKPALILLKALALPGDAAIELNHAVSRIADAKENIDLTDILTDAAHLINNAYTPTAGADQSDLSLVLANVSLPDQTRLQIDSLKRRLGDIHSKAEALRVAGTIANALESALRDSPTTYFPARDLVPALTRLLDWFPESDRYSGRIRGMRKKISELQQREQLEQILRQFAMLVVDLHADLRMELQRIEEFLAKLDARLIDIRSDIENLSDVEIRNQASKNSLAKIVRNNVMFIRKRVERADNPEELKKLVNETVYQLERAVSDHVRHTNINQARTRSKINKLLKAVAAAKSEADNLRQNMADEASKARTDALTHIPNRLAFDGKFEAEFNRWQRYGHALSLCVIDVDLFKQVNDQFGHLAGDRVLKSIADLCKSRIRETDFLARYGGEEFVLILPDTGLDEALVAAESIRCAIDECGFHYAGKPVSITVSCGIASVRKGDQASSFFERADRALYAAKQSGRNRCVDQRSLS